MLLCGTFCTQRVDRSNMGWYLTRICPIFYHFEMKFYIFREQNNEKTFSEMSCKKNCKFFQKKKRNQNRVKNFWKIFSLKFFQNFSHKLGRDMSSIKVSKVSRLIYHNHPLSSYFRLICYLCQKLLRIFTRRNENE